MLNIVFMGTPDFAKDSLEALVEKGHNVLAVVTNPDRPKGRGMQMQVTEVKEYALLKKLNIYQPEYIKENKEFIETIKQLNPDILCVVAYGKILPKEILEIAKLGAINVHGSVLPKYRGAAPIQWAVINGEKTTGVTTIYMDVGMDTGDIILTKETEIGEDETTGELWGRLSKIGAELLIETLEKIEKGNVSRQKQGEEYTMAPMLEKEMFKIKWDSLNTKQIKDLIRGLNPIAGAYTFLDGKKYKIWKTAIISEHLETTDNNEPGTIIFVDEKKGMHIKTKDGILSILEIQAENSKKMNICDFLRGNKILIGQVFK